MTYRKQIVPESPQSYEEKLVATHGEVIDRITAARILNVSRNTVTAYVNAEFFRTAPNGKIIVRSLAQWIYGNPKAVKSSKIVVMP